MLGLVFFICRVRVDFRGTVYFRIKFTVYFVVRVTVSFVVRIKVDVRATVYL